MSRYLKINHIFATAFVCCLLLSSCNESDDVGGIFTDKTWKLTGIYTDTHKPQIVTDHWTSPESEANSKKKWEAKASYVITFNGLVDKNKINGTYDGTVSDGGIKISGSWNADGESNVFSASPPSSNDNDELAKAYLKALGSAYKYSGDYNNLQLHFKVVTGTVEKKRYLSFRKVNE